MSAHREEIHRRYGIRHVAERPPISLVVDTRPFEEIPISELLGPPPEQHERSCPCERCVEFVTGKKLPPGWEIEVERKLNEDRRGNAAYLKVYLA